MRILYFFHYLFPMNDIYFLFLRKMVKARAAITDPDIVFFNVAGMPAGHGSNVESPKNQSIYPHLINKELLHNELRIYR